MVEKRLVWRYADLFLSIAHNPAGFGYRVQGHLPDGVEKSAVITNPLSAEELDQVRLAFADPKSGAVIAQRVGRRLFDSVFSGDVALLRALVLHGLKRGQGLRLRFRSGAADTSDWPVELLHDSRDFLALRRRSPIVRYLGSPKPVDTVRMAGPLRILVVVSNVASQVPLDVETEWDEIRQGLAPLAQKRKLDIKRLDNPTLSELAEALAQGVFHVLHFMGHGSLAPMGEGVLLLRDSEGPSVAVSGATLAFVLRAHPSMRLVILNACEGACAGRDDRFSGVAQSLIREEIPAVVAMQARIPDDSAVVFASRFYRELAKGSPVDRAVTEARRSLYVRRNGKDLDWAIPVLFLGTSDGKLFEQKRSSAWIWAPLLILALLLTFWRWAPWKPHCPSLKTVDMEMAWIPEGTFSMASGKKGEPPIEVSIPRPFCLGTTEVSQKQWETVMGTNTAKDMEPRGDDLPIGGVTYEETQDFTSRLNASEETDAFRLPTKEEWEYAARGPGEGEGGNCLHGDDYSGLAPAGTFRNNDWGLYDMLGNVWEWVDQPGRLGLLGEQSEPSKAGGAFDSAPKKCLATARSPRGRDHNQKNTGFRIVREIQSSP